MVCYIPGESGLDQSKKLDKTEKRLRIWGIVLVMNHEFPRANGGFQEAGEDGVTPANIHPAHSPLGFGSSDCQEREKRRGQRAKLGSSGMKPRPASPAFLLEQWLATGASFCPPR